MEYITLTDLFFWVTGIAVIIITTLLVIALLYLIFFLRTIKKVLDTAKKTADFISDDVNTLRKNIKKDGFSLKALIKFALGLNNKGKNK